jgi:hypothetical protein
LRLAPPSQWRLVLRTEDEAEASKRYQKVLEDMRQGEVHLRRAEQGQAKLVKRAWAPALRTRW